MSSRRFPGKVLASLGSEISLGRIVRICRTVDSCQRVIVATSTEKNDDEIVEFCHAMNIEVYRGELENVAGRFYALCKTFSSSIKHIGRVTADCPLIDREVCEAVINHHLTVDADYTHTGLTYPDGLDFEVFKLSAFTDLYEQLSEPEELEHVTLGFRTRKTKYKIEVLECFRDLTQYRVTVDYPEDLQLVRQILSIANDGKKSDHLDCNFRQLIRILESNRTLFPINSKFERNEALKAYNKKCDQK